jgi:hypothetical protein
VVLLEILASPDRIRTDYVLGTRSAPAYSSYRDLDLADE